MKSIVDIIEEDLFEVSKISETKYVMEDDLKGTLNTSNYPLVEVNIKSFLINLAAATNMSVEHVMIYLSHSNPTQFPELAKEFMDMVIVTSDSTANTRVADYDSAQLKHARDLEVQMEKIKKVEAALEAGITPTRTAMQQQLFAVTESAKKIIRQYIQECIEGRESISWMQRGNSFIRFDDFPGSTKCLIDGKTYYINYNMIDNISPSHARGVMEAILHRARRNGFNVERYLRMLSDIMIIERSNKRTAGSTISDIIDIAKTTYDSTPKRIPVRVLTAFSR